VTGDQAKSQFSFTQYYSGFGFFGGLTTLTTDTMYAVQLSLPSTLTFSGTPTTLPKSVSLNTGWTYLPCPYQTSVGVSDGVPTGVDFNLNDMFKSQFSFTSYYPGYGWFGSLAAMDPGEGYNLQVTGTGGTAVFGVVRRKLGTVSTPAGLAPLPRMRPPQERIPHEWILEPRRFSESMGVVALVSVGELNQTAGALAAFVGAEVRGVQAAPSVAPFGRYAGRAIYHLTIHANAGGEKLTFRFCSNSATTTALAQTLTFTVDGHVGSAIAPFVLSAPARSRLFGVQQ